MRIRLFAAMSLLLVSLLGAGCTPDRDFDSRLGSIVKPYRFSIVKWEFKTIPSEAKQWLFGKHERNDDQTDIVAEYFLLVERIKSLESEITTINADNEQGDLASIEAELNRLQEQRMALAGKVERIITRQIKEALAQEGIFNPVDKHIGLKGSFPPLDFRLEKPPHLLVISPRDRIESMREITLQQNLGLEEMESIEARVDK
ncbi:unnamed protein product, partial [marine sediment metagenome]